MITPAEIKKKALGKYRRFLLAALREEELFPLEISGNKGSVKMPLAKLLPALRQLLNHSKSKKGYGYEVELREINTRHAGTMSMPDHIYFSTASDYLQFLGKRQEFARFQRQVEYTRLNAPQLIPFLNAHPWRLIAYLDVWPDLIKVVQYFLANPRPNLYLRELPIAVHTKFIEQNKGIVGELLNAVLPETAFEPAEKQFEKRYGLRYDEALIRFRFFDSETIPELPSSIRDLALPASAFAQLKTAAAALYIVENKQTFLAFPQRSKSLIIWGKGFAVELLKEIPWLADKQIWFWGDLDLQGFQMLHQLRSYFPQTRSLLMDRAAYDAFASYAVRVNHKTNVAELSTLTPTEKEMFDFLKETKANRLEQEHISQQFLIDRLNN